MGDDAVVLFTALGGQAGTAAIVDRFYDRMVADPKVAAHFVHVPLQALKRRKAVFLAAICGGPALPGERSLQQAHDPYSLTQADFARMTEHFAEALADCLVPSELAELVLALFGLFRQDLTTVTFPDPVSPAGDA